MDLSEKTFTAADYVIFGLMLAISTAVGFFYAVKDRRRQNTDEYLVGGRSMEAIPVAFSLSVGFMSAILVLGSPADIYLYGTMYTWYIVGFLISIVVTAEVFIPIFYRLELTSVYEYLERRFNRGVRILAILIFMTQTVLYIGIVIYAPALALNAVTGFNLWGAVISTGSICIIYSSLGGLKAVIWTDAIQAVFMLTGFLSIIIQGSISLGGFGNVLKRCEEGNRTVIFNFDPDPRLRQSFWSCTAGFTFLGLSMYAVNQGQVQRYLSCKSLADAKKAVLLNWVGLLLLNGFAIMCGMILYAYYKDCDPLTLGLVNKSDQLLPFLVLDIFKSNPGMPGVFLACVYSGSLSTVSTAITALSTVTIQDFLRPWFKWKDSTFVWISKGLVVLYGIICIIFAYLTSQLGDAILEAAIKVLGLLGGPLVGIYSLGMLFPFTNSIGALVGSAMGLASNILIFIGSRSFPPPPQFQQLLHVTTASCSNVTSTNVTTTSTSPTVTSPVTSDVTPSMDRPPVADLYALSYLYYPALGWLVTVVIGILVSLATCGHRNRKQVDPALIHPFFDHVIFSWLPIGARKACRCGVEQDEGKDKTDETEVRARANDNLAYIYDESDKL